MSAPTRGQTPDKITSLGSAYLKGGDQHQKMFGKPELNINLKRMDY